MKIDTFDNACSRLSLNTRANFRILVWGMVVSATLLAFLVALPAQAASTRRAAFLQAAMQQPNVLYTLKLSDGQSAVVYKSGIAKVYSADFSSVETRMITGLAGQAQGFPPLQAMGRSPSGSNSGVLTKAAVRLQLSKPVHLHPYARATVLVVYRNGVHASRDVVNVSAAELEALRQTESLTGMVSPSQAPHYTTNQQLNVTLASLGVDRSTRLFRSISSSRLRAMSARASTASGHPVLNIGNAYRLHITNATVRAAVATLRHSTAVAYASPAFYVSTTHTRPVPLGSSTKINTNAQLTPVMGTTAGAASQLPDNYGLQSSLQSFLNAPSLNMATAYDEIMKKFGQMPGTGETITNVSIGDLDDAGAASNPNDPCNRWVNQYGPTTVIQGGQRYLDWPSMPLIPTWTADASGNLDGTGEVCGVAPLLDEVGLDFSVMAPLPHDRQRPGATGSFMTDLLGIAPGADYRLVVPDSSAPTIADIDAALLAAAQQRPHPDVITASLGYGYDSYGFPGRYLGDDPLSRSIVSTIVNSYGIVVTIASNDGIRGGGFTSPNTSVSPSGSAAPTDLAQGNPTDLDDIFFSTMPSRDPDTGAIAVGGTTLDDIFAAPPQNSANAALKAQHAFAETRWTGTTTFASGYGSRVNVSAPGDNIASFVHTQGGAANDVTVVLGGGVSASAPEVGAAAAVLLQVARLTGQPFAGPKALRDFLIQTGTPVPKVPQSDVHNHVGPQVNLGEAVETLLAKADNAISPQVTSVAVEQRRSTGNGGANFQSDTNPAAISLSGANLRDWITIAPDWEGLPDDASYTLQVEPLTGPRNGQASTKVAASSTVAGAVLAHTPWARVLPKKIFAAAGLPLASGDSRTLLFTYTATAAGMTPVTAKFALTFGPVSAEQIAKPLAPLVPPVVTGNTIPVHYDLRNTGFTNARLIVSQPGRVTPWTGFMFHVAYSTPIEGEGTVNVPVSALEMGGGIYGIAIQAGNGGYTQFAFTRVQPEASKDRPPAPLLSANGSMPSYFLEMPYGSDASVSWDVSGVPGATGVILEFSAAGPNAAGSYATFNNPNGSEPDNGNAVDTGSIYHLRLSGTTGTKTFDGAFLENILVPTLYENVRVIPVAGGTAVGEAGRISTLIMDGVASGDGGSPDNGWGINAHGSDGFITSVQQTASGTYLGSLEVFDQPTSAVTHVVFPTKPNLFYYTPAFSGVGIYGGDLGLYASYNYATGQGGYHTLDPVAKGTVGNAWTPPSISIQDSATNSDTGVGVFYGTAPGTALFPKRMRVFTSDIAANTFSPVYDFSGPLQSMGLGGYYGLAENTRTNMGLLTAHDIVTSCRGPAVLVFFSLADGSIKNVVQSPDTGQPTGVAWDAQTNKIAIPSLCDHNLDLYNANTGQAQLIALPAAPNRSGQNGLYTAADPIHHYFLVTQVTGPHAVGSPSWVNNNAHSVVYVLDEDGNIVKSLHDFNLFNIRLPIQANNLQVNPETGTGYLPGLGYTQLEPFRYMNRAPVASDGTLVTRENTPASGVLHADSSYGNPLTYSIVDQPQHGSVTLQGATVGAYTYVPDKNYSGSDSFTFKASNGDVVSNVATVAITVKATNHAPVANDGSLATDENTAAGGSLKASDPDGDSLTFSIVGQPQHGSVTLDDATTGAYTYTPTTGYSGSDSFTFKANDGQADSNTATISITVNPVTPTPPPPPPSNGGGGALGWLALATLFGLMLPVVWQKRRRVR